jgi:hypothetical protein
MERKSMIRAAAATGALLLAGLAFGQADWTKLSPAHAPSKRLSPAMAQFGNGSNVVMFGGLNLGPSGVFNQHNVLGDTWQWNGSDWAQVTSFFLTPTLPAPRFGASMAYDPTNKRTLLFGGVDVNGNVLSDTWLFGTLNFCLITCTSRFQWTQLTFAAGASPPGRRDASMGFNPSAGIVLTGGAANNGTKFQDTWVFIGSTNTWSHLNVINSPTPGRSLAPMAQCDAGSPFQISMFFGGTNSSSTPLGDTWDVLPEEGNFFVWGKATPTPSPAARFGHGMAYYPVSDFDVLFGGSIGFIEGVGQLLVSDTWNGSCNGPKWTQATPAHSPGTRSLQGMTTGPSGLKVLLFGGSDVPPSSSLPNGRDHNDTWVWGRQVACVPVDGSQLSVGSEVTCQFDTEFDPAAQFVGWNAVGFAPPFKDRPTMTFHTEGPGSAAITANWTDTTGPHSQTFDYTITHPHH